MAYKIKSAIIYEDIDGERYLARTVHEDEEQWTGLYDESGRKIYKTMDQIGFNRRNEGWE
jgi:hypothetical protein